MAILWIAAPRHCGNGACGAAAERDRHPAERFGRLLVALDDVERIVERVQDLDGAHDDAAERVAAGTFEPDLVGELRRQWGQLRAARSMRRDGDTFEPRDAIRIPDRIEGRTPGCVGTYAMAEHYWCFTHDRVEQTKVCRAANRLGPYESAAAARQWQQRLENRHEAWKAADKEWHGEDDSDD